MDAVVAVVGGSAAVAVGGLLFAAYRLGLLYQLFHKVGGHYSNSHYNHRGVVFHSLHASCMKAQSTGHLVQVSWTPFR